MFAAKLAAALLISLCTILGIFSFTSTIDDVEVEGKKVSGSKNKGPEKCSGAPYLYATVHDEIHNVLKFSRDGCLLSTNELNNGPMHFDTELRSVAQGEYHKEGEDSRQALFVADASHIDSKLLVYTRCNYESSSMQSASAIPFESSDAIEISPRNQEQVDGQVHRNRLRSDGEMHSEVQRVFMPDSSNHSGHVDAMEHQESDLSPWCYQDIVTSTSINPGADHTYGTTFDKDGNVYASFQHTNVVLRFYADTFEPMPINPAFQSKHKHRSKYAFRGTFVQFGEARKHKKSDQGVRSIVAVGDKIWITNEFKDMILVASADTADTIHIVSLRNPIGLYYDEEKKTVFVSSRKGKFGGCIYAVDSETYAIKTHYRTKKFKHPTGIVTYGDTMFVAEQKHSNIHTFSISTRKHLGIVSRNVPGKVEQLMIYSG